MSRIAARFAALRVGTPEMDLDCGPLINARQRARVVMRGEQIAGFGDARRVVIFEGCGFHLVNGLLKNASAELSRYLRNMVLCRKFFQQPYIRGV